MTHIQTVTVGDMRVNVSGNGPALICVHGFTTTSEFWKEQIETFSRDHLLIRFATFGSNGILIGLSMGGTISNNSRYAIRTFWGLVLVVGDAARSWSM
jgi:pimeloyl-ACP methyl ester carboxylesterase